MSAGPIIWSSAYPSDPSGSLFPNFHVGAGTNFAPVEEGLGVKASITYDVTWQLRYPMPPSIPAGTMKLHLLALANAATGVAKVTVKDAVGSPGASPSAASGSVEGQITVVWGAGDADKYKEARVSLTAAPSGNDMLVLGLGFNSAGWTLAQTSTWIPVVIWE